MRRIKKITEPIENYYNISDNSLSPYQEMRRKEVFAIIKETMQGLSDGQRQVVHLRDIEGYTYKEMAVITGFSVDKIKVYLHRARINLRKALMKYKNDLDG